LVRDDASGLAACIDTPDAEAILRELDQAGWRLALILNTHWHPAYVGGDAAVKAATGATIVGPAEVRKLAPPDREVGDADIVELGDTRFEVLDTGGHTLGHLSYYDAVSQRDSSTSILITELSGLSHSGSTWEHQASR
jgi:hydroxyacylglutathione hydrolase